MILHRTCPLCKSTILEGFAIDTKRKGPHISRVKCKSCELVFANPMADRSELVEYYQNYYEKDHYESTHYKKIILEHFERIKSLTAIEIRSEARYLKKLKEGTNFLDVGCGLGLGLAFANQLDCRLYATEFDTGALEFVRAHFPVQTFQGDIWEAGYPSDFFDFIHISHVIEHVLDPSAYLQEMRRILKPGGYLAIGTPDMGSRMYTYHRWINLLSLRVPDIIDGLEHTFIFPRKTLAKLCVQENFQIDDHFTHNLGEKIRNLISYKMPVKKKVNRLIQNLFQVNQWIVCEKFRT